MGAENGDRNEKPVHRVYISEGFYMGKYEVTQAQWTAVMGSNPSNFKGCDDCPVEQVSWNDAQEFIKKLNGQNDGYVCRSRVDAGCPSGHIGQPLTAGQRGGWSYGDNKSARGRLNGLLRRFTISTAKSHPEQAR